MVTVSVLTTKNGHTNMRPKNMSPNKKVQKTQKLPLRGGGGQTVEKM